MCGFVRDRRESVVFGNWCFVQKTIDRSGETGTVSMLTTMYPIINNVGGGVGRESNGVTERERR